MCILTRAFILFGVFVLVSCATPRQQTGTSAGRAASSDESKLPWRETEGISAQSWQEKQQQNLALLADDPAHPDAHAILADMYFKQLILAASPAFKRWAHYHSEKALKAKPNDLVVRTSHYRLLYTLVRLEGEPAALNQLREFYSTLPESMRNGLFPPSLAFYLYQSEQVHKDSDKNLRAEHRPILLQALKEQPGNALIHVQLSRYYFDSRQIDLAFAVLHQALRLEPTSPQVLLAMAEAYRNLAQRDECIYDHLDEIKRSTQFYKQLLSQPSVEAQVHWGLMVNYAHLGLAPLSIREGEQAIGPQATALNRWGFATFLMYQGQAKRAEELFLSASAEIPKTPSRALVEHYLLLGQWRKAALAFTAYISAAEQPGITDLLLASMIQAESQDKTITLSSLWRTEKKALYFNEFDEALAKYWRGELNEQAFAGHVKSTCQQATFEFYVGYSNLLNNQVAKAKASFEKAKAHPQPMNFEVQMATQFLRGLLDSRAPNK
ncbi:MAG: hypothetical protein RL497_317 [Pseudomonadota bacterium]